MNRKYWSTFYSPRSGRDYIQSFFLDNRSDDSLRIIIFNYQEDKWSEIREDVKMWVREKWPEWTRERPSWFTDGVKARIPADMIPAGAPTRSSAEVRGA